MEKECFACSHYRPYYTKGYCTFNKKDFGECSVTQTEIDKHHPCCDKFYAKYYGKHTDEFVIKKLNDILNALSTLLVVYRENHEHDKK